MNYYILYYLLNPILLATAIIMVKPDEFLVTIGTLLTILAIIRIHLYDEGMSKIWNSLMLTIGLLTPVISKGKLLFLPLFIMILLLRSKNTTMKKHVLLIIIFSLLIVPMIAPLLVEWFRVYETTKLTQILHPGFYTLYVIFRVIPIEIDKIAMMLGKFLSNLTYIVIMAKIGIIILLSKSIKDIEAENILPIVISYMLYSLSLDMLIVPAVPIHYLTSITALLPLYVTILRNNKVKTVSYTHLTLPTN